MDMLKLLLVEDHPLMRQALTIALTEETNLDVVAETSDGMEGIALYKKHHPDVVIMDLLLPGIDGVQAIAEIITSDPEAKILVLSSLEDEDHILSAVQAGALGYVPKTAARQYLVEGVFQVARGIPYLPPNIAARLFKGLRQAKPAVPAASETPAALTTRQNEILALLSEGRSDQEIARILHVGPSTVRAHVHHILQRLGLGTRSQAIAYAHRHQSD